MSEPPWPTDIRHYAAIVAAADSAFAGNSPVILTGQDLALLPDVIVLELVANGIAPRDGQVVMRDDGRSAVVVTYRP
jgi:hypothetical protein